MKDAIHSADFEHDAVSKFMDEVTQSIERDGEWTMRFSCCPTREEAEWLVRGDGRLFVLEPPSPVPPPPEHWRK